MGRRVGMVGGAMFADLKTIRTRDALPLPDAEGKVTVLMTEPKERDDTPAQKPAEQSYIAGIDDEIPF